MRSHFYPPDRQKYKRSVVSKIRADMTQTELFYVASGP